MREVISIQVFFVLNIFVIFQALLIAANCPAKPLHKIGLQVNCYIGNTTNSVSCFDSIEVDTKANITCKYGYQNSGDIEIQEITCQSNSEWSAEPMHCEDICVSNTDALALKFVNNRIENVLSQTPWHISILINTRNIEIYNYKVFKCTGVILNAKLILTAHACVRPFDNFEMTVMSSKFKYPIDSIELYAQKSGVKKVYTNYNFMNNGTDFYQTTQVAILELIQPFEYTEFVRSACIDWSAITDEVYNSNPVGFASLWHNFANCLANVSTLYIELNSKEFPGIQHDNCTSETETPFDIFCYKAYSDHKDFCYPRPGGGIMLKQQLENGSTRKLLWGLALLATFNPPGKDDPRYFNTAVFINIWHQKDFIMEYMEKFKASNILSYEYTNKACPTVDFDRKKLIVKCEINSEDKPCDNDIKPGTIVSIQCKKDYEKPTIDKPDEIKCLEEGLWSDEFYQCELICGKVENVPKKQTLVPLSLGGVETDIVNVPWQIAIYSNNTSRNQRKWTLICGGTLIHPNIVISAAHCFWDPTFNDPFDPYHYLIASGKRYREYDASETNAQYSKILQIRIPTTFVLTSLRNDVAVLVLEKKLIFSAHTKPACLEWSSYGNYDYQTGITGLVAGWGSTSQYSDTSHELRFIKIPTIDASLCQHLVDPEYKDIITGENFCAQGSMGETACSGDSGGGFLIPKIDENGIERYYLIGIVSAGADPAKHCTEHFISTYTNVQYHQDIIKVTAANNTQI